MRLATQHDVADILVACAYWMPRSPAPQMAFADPITYECGIRHAIHEGRAWMIHGYFVMVDVGSDWYTTKKYLIEQLVLRVHDTPYKVRDVVDCLDTIREHYKADAIIVGDTQIGHMTPIYQAAGFKTIGTQLMK